RKSRLSPRALASKDLITAHCNEELMKNLFETPAV
ncbi:MAG: hypothetical protein ACI9CV_001382, partial [Ilumatobacter sp.]